MTQPGDASDDAPDADLRRRLAAALASVNEYYAGLVGDQDSVIETRTPGFLRKYRMYRVEHRGRRRPVGFFIGYTPGGTAYALTERPDNFLSMARADGVVITTQDEAVEYAVTYLEVTRRMSEVSYVISAVAGMKFRPNLEPEEAQRRDAVLRQYCSAIAPPMAKPAGEGFSLSALMVHEQSLERHELMVRRDGDIKDTCTVLERDLPLIYGH